jgi:ABC-2 type transport system ATP-binding protein
MQHAFYAILADLRSMGRTIFFSSHVLSEVERVCDRVAIIREGRLMTVSDVRELLGRRRRRITIRWRGEAPDLTSIPGLSELRADGDRLTAALEGDVVPFVRAVASPSLVDLTIEPASLEEAFLEYYADGQTPPQPAQPAPEPHGSDRSARSDGSGPSGRSPEPLPVDEPTEARVGR